MPRSLSTYRRRANLVDIYLNARINVASYNFKRSANFDGAFVTFQNVPAAGFRSLTAQEPSFADGMFRDKTRFIFNPVDYSFVDADPLWLKIQPISTAGVVGTDESIHLVLPYSFQPRRPVVLRGGAPSGATIANSLEINFPMQCQGVNIENDGAVDLFVAFDINGPEFRVPAFSTTGPQFSVSFPAFSQVFVRGLAGTPTFSLVTSLRNEALS